MGQAVVDESQAGCTIPWSLRYQEQGGTRPFGQIYYNVTTGRFRFGSANGTWVDFSTVISGSIPINAQTGRAYTLNDGDNGKTITLNNADPITLTIPAGLGAGFNCKVIQAGAGAITVAASGTTINQFSGADTTAGQGAVAQLMAYAADTFVLSGDVVTAAPRSMAMGFGGSSTPSVDASSTADQQDTAPAIEMPPVDKPIVQKVAVSEKKKVVFMDVFKSLMEKKREWSERRSRAFPAVLKNSWGD